MPRRLPAVIGLLVLTLAVPVPPAFAAPAADAVASSSGGRDERTIRCESGSFGRYRECRVDTDNRVSLVRERSRNKCRQWNSWGYDRQAVWVDKGCRAEFRVGKDGGGVGAGTVAVIGAVAGAAIIGAIIAGRNKNDHTDVAKAPDWARGTFGGFSPKTDTEFEITVTDAGQVTGTAGTEALTGHISGTNRLHLGDVEFERARESWGFAAKQRDDADNVIYFRRR